MTAAPIPHGTASGYSSHKCRCGDCKAYKRRVDRERYERKIGRPVRIPMTDEERAAKNRERVKAWQQANPDRVKAQAARSRERRREKLREQGRERYRRLMAEDPERVRRQRREWAKTPKGRLAYRNAQEMRRRGVPYTDEALEWIASLEDPVCFYCGAPATEIDHLTPITRGGTGERENLAPSCRPCNASKGAMTAEKFLSRKESADG